MVEEVVDRFRIERVAADDVLLDVPHHLGDDGLLAAVSPFPNPRQTLIRVDKDVRPLPTAIGLHELGRDVSDFHKNLGIKAYHEKHER